MIKAVNMTDAAALLGDAPARLLASDGIKGQPPMEREVAAIERPSDGVRVGLWACGPYQETYDSYPVDEFMVMISGRVELVYPDGSTDTFMAGDAFVLPKGFAGIWRQPEEVVKYFAIIA